MYEGQQDPTLFKKVKFNNLKYLINEEEKTASIIESPNTPDHVTIPGSINYRSQNYNVTSINEGAFKNSIKIKSIRFSKNSKIKTIEKSAFEYSTLKSITIPASLIELKDSWCQRATNLVNVKIDSKNDRYSMYENKFIIGKSSPEKENFDSLIFCIRDIKNVTIPNFIEIIEPFAFNFCSKIESIEFPSDSKLRIIKTEAFSFSTIKKIKIPPSLTKICESAFNNCTHLEEIEIPSNSNLQVIESNAFYNTLIESIKIPSILNKGWCNGTKINKISFMSNNDSYTFYENKFILRKSSPEKENFDSLVFCVRNIENVTIPNFIEIIEPFAFNKCLFIKNVEIPDDSKLTIIMENAFSYSSIENISIPCHLTKICEGAFLCCDKLTNVEIPTISNLRIIEKNAFYNTCIERLTIPSSLVELEDEWCNVTTKLNHIKISPNNENFLMYDEKFIIGKSSPNADKYDVIVFAVRDIKTVIIPDFIRFISPYAFQTCMKINSIEFSKDSKIETIENNTFSYSSIKSISIPKKINKICKESFLLCTNLEKVEIPENSELTKFDNYSFSHSSIKKIFIPKNVTVIEENAFCSCQKLQKVEIPTNSKLKIIGKKAFYNTQIRSISIPPQITYIDDSSFKLCQNLQIVEILSENGPDIINEDAFYSLQSLIIFIPYQNPNF